MRRGFGRWYVPASFQVLATGWMWACASTPSPGTAGGSGFEGEDPQVRALIETLLGAEDPIACDRVGSSLQEEELSPRARAWVLICRAEHLRDGSAFAAAEAWLAESPSDPWAAFARVATRAVARLEGGEREALLELLDAIPELQNTPDRAWLSVQLGRTSPAPTDKPGAFSRWAECAAILSHLDKPVEASRPGGPRLEAAIRAHWADPCVLAGVGERARRRAQT